MARSLGIGCTLCTLASRISGHSEVLVELELGLVYVAKQDWLRWLINWILERLDDVR